MGFLKLFALVGVVALPWLAPRPAAAVVNLGLRPCQTVDHCADNPPLNFNGSVEPGERGQVRVTVQNTGTTDATNVTATVTTSTPGVMMLVDTTSFGTIPMRGSAIGVPDIEFQVEPTVACGTMIVLDFTITSDQQTVNGQCTIMVAAAPCQICAAPMTPLLRLDGCTLTADGCAFGLGHMNGDIEPGEVGVYSFTVTNIGSANATGIVVNITSPTRGIMPAMWSIPLPNMGPGRMETANVNFTLDLQPDCGDPVEFNFSIQSTQGTWGGQCSFDIPVPCEVCARNPVLDVAACVTTDDCAFGGPGDGNGIPEPGESASLEVSVENSGPVDATNVTATVSFASAGVNVTPVTVNFGTIAAGATVAGDVPILYTVDPTFACGSNLAIGLTIDSDQGPFNGGCVVALPPNCNICVATPDLGATCTYVSDDCALGGSGDANGAVDPGETAEFSISVTNTGTGDATGVSATVTSTTMGVNVTGGTTSFGMVAVGATVAGDVTISYTVADFVPCGSSITFDVLIASDQGSFMETCTVTIPVACSPCVPGPQLQVTSCVPTDDCAFGGAGDGDGSVDPGETATVLVNVRNGGLGDASNVQAMVTSASPGLTIDFGNLSYGTIAAGNTAASVVPMSITVDDTVACGTNLTFTVSLTSDEGPFSDDCTIVVPVGCTVCTDVPQVDPQLRACGAMDACAAGGAGDADGNIDPGETATMLLTIDNMGAAGATNVSATVTSPTPGIAFTVPTANFGNIAAGGNASGDVAIEFSLASSVPCGTNVQFDVTISTDQGNFVRNCAIMVPVNCTPCANTAPPGEVPFMITRCTAADGLVVEWTPAPNADSHNIYQGTIAAFRTATPYDHGCSVGNLVMAPPLSTTLTTTTCGDGLDLYFLVVGENANGEGPYGYQDADHDAMPDAPRPAGNPLCP